MQLLQQGDAQAFSILFERYWERLTDYAYKRLQLREEAEEVVQELFINLYERRQELDIHTSLEAYLHTAVRNRVYSRFRTWMRQQKAFLVANLEDVDYALPPADTAAYKDLETHMGKALQKLPEKCRAAFLLSREQGHSYKEIAQQLGISVNTLEKHIGKALRILRLELGRYEQLCLLAGFIIILANE